jgi:hypothetical protein
LGGFFLFQGRSPIGLGLVELLGRDGVLLPQLPDALVRLFKQFGLALVSARRSLACLISSSRLPSSVFFLDANAARRAASAWCSLAVVSGLSRSTTGSPLVTAAPSLTRMDSIRPVILGEMSIWVASISPWT